MQIEFTCSNCNSLLRLPSEHEGKKARCPICGTIVPVQSASRTQPSPNPISLTPEANEPSPFPPSSDSIGKKSSADFSSPIDPSSAASAYAPPNYYSAQLPTTATAQDGYFVGGLVMGILSISSLPCGCFCWASILPLTLGIVGLALSSYSRSPSRWVGFLLNGIAVGISLLVVVGFILVFVLGGA